MDAVVEKATAEGAKILKPVQDQFYGDRSGFFQDPFGHLWGVATHVEDVSPEEMKERMKKMMPCLLYTSGSSKADLEESTTWEH